MYGSIYFTDPNDPIDVRFRQHVERGIRRILTMTDEDRQVLWRMRCAMLRYRVAMSIWQESI